MSDGYVHGYLPRETERLRDQAAALVGLLHSDTGYPAGSRVLEAGCGTGAQTVTLAARSPGATIVAVDREPASLAEAQARVAAVGLTGVEFRQADILALRFEPGSFDHVFVCFVLEHLPRPDHALAGLRELLRPGGTLTVIEGDHGSVILYPESAAARAAIDCQATLQARAGGDARIGRRVYPLMAGAGLRDVWVTPRVAYVDGSRPELATAVTRDTFTAMIEGVREPAVAAGLTDPAAFDEGVRALHRTTEPDGVFSYTFFKGVGVR